MSLIAPDARHYADRDALATLVADCRSSGVGRRVLLLHADRLPPAMSRPHHLRLAREALLPLEGATRARLYDLGTDRVAVSWRGDDAGVLNRALALFAHLIADAPAGTPSLSELIAIYDLPKDGPALLASLGATTLPASPDAAPPPPLLPRARAPLDAPALAGMEAALVQADVSRFARQRPVWRVGGAGASDDAAEGRRELAPKGAQELAWYKRHLSVTELTAELAPGCDPYAEPWLFHRLTRTLDRRMLSMLSVPGELRSGSATFSINLNVATIVSPEFLRFDMLLPAGLRGRVILELLPADIVADPAAYLFARSFVRQRGYRLLLRDVEAELLPMLSLDRFDPDYVALRWAESLPSPGVLSLPRPERIVLSRADTQDAVRWGAAQGIRLFKGRALAATAVGAAR